MRKPIDYRALFSEEAAHSLLALTRELEELLAVQPAPPDYRAALHDRLMLAARDESFYRRDVQRRLLLSMSVVVSVLLGVIGLIAWRSRSQRTAG